MSQPGDESRGGDGARATGTRRAALFAALSAQAADLAMCWLVQARKILLLDAPRSDDCAGTAPDVSVAQDLTRALLSAFSSNDDASEETAVAAGFQFGVEAFTRGASLHHTVKAMNALCGMIMQAMVKASAENKASAGNVADGIWLAQRLQERAGLLSLAVIRGHTQAHGDALRDEFRHLRHDLRNPLGTIKSVLALMDDESVPAEARANANFRAMAKRNARSLEVMIADRLGDTAVPLPAAVDRDVCVQEVAESVRRELANEAKRRDITVVVDATEVQGRFDVSGLELLLQAVLEEAFQESHAGTQLHLTCKKTDDGRIALYLSHASSYAPIARREVIDRLTMLARGIGASATFTNPVVISLPMHDRAQGSAIATERAISAEVAESGIAEKAHNLRSAREDDHGQPSVL